MESIVVIERSYCGYRFSAWEFYQAFKLENKQHAKDFVKKKNSNNNCSYEYRCRTLKLR